MRIVLLPLGLALVGLAGCQAPAQPEYLTAALLPVADEAEFDRLWICCTDVLRRYDFQPDRQDRRAGVITTVPVTSAHWFEFWRRDVLDPYSFAESNLAAVRRAATVRLQPGESADQKLLTVRVDVQRLSTPERQVTSPAGGLQIFGKKLPTTQGRLLKGASPDRWIPDRRDPHLEFALLSRMVNAYRPGRFEYVDYDPAGRLVQPEATTP